MLLLKKKVDCLKKLIQTNFQARADICSKRRNIMYEVGTPCNSGKRKLRANVKLSIDGKEIEMVPFVQNILVNTITAVIKELDGYSDDSKVEIKINE